MSNAELISIGEYVSKKMPVITNMILTQASLNVDDTMDAISEILNVEKDKMVSVTKMAEVVDARTVFISYSINKCIGKRSRMIMKLAGLLKKTPDGILKAFNNHTEWMQYSYAYREKYLTIENALNIETI